METTQKTNGFSLIELVIVIVLLSVVTLTVTTIFTDTTENYLQSEERLSMASSSRLAVERISREIREAMPNSVRVSSNNLCVEFVPILAATQYETLPTSTADTSLRIIEADASTELSGLSTSSLFVMVIPLNSSEVYDTSSGHVATVSAFSKLGSNITEVTISSTQFLRESPQRRIFFVSEPVSFCVDGSNLNRYESYGFSLSQPFPSAMGAANLIINKVLSSNNGNPVSVFTYSSGALNRSGILLMNLLFQGRNEVIQLDHEVHIRNFP
ncbi:prepilin-type N-terminal cleavage/methylation domain-containing protein [Pleionea sediminis]|uniref:prepilin-type N-terminal cleavage/methylation domain-containing protein n=1 Tax=Pleionea sediminis TaxID=2569479 RepID=UPI001186584B|nr:prepilin-type N-terminal cleavage/methylation domain-containing protein [Pleionea sediminis]